MFNNSSSNFLFNLVKDKPSYIIAAYILSFSSTVFNALAITLLIPLLFYVLNGQLSLVNSDFSYGIQQLSILCNYLNENYRLSILIGLVFLMSLVSIIFAYFNSIINIKHTQHLTDEIKATSFNLLFKIDLSYYHHHKISDILFKVNRETDKAVLAIKNTQKIVCILISLSIFILVLILISLKLTLITVILLCFSYYINVVLKNSFKKQEALLSQKSKKYNCQTIEFLAGIEHIKNTANESAEYQNIIKSIEAKSKVEVATKATYSLIEPVNRLLGILIILIVSIACYYLYNGRTEIYLPILLVYLLILFKLLSLISKLNNARVQNANNQFSIKIISSFLQEINQPIIKSGTAIFSKLKHKIELRNVTFAYPNHAQIVLDKINISIAKGDTVALVGSAGAGKSSLVSLLSRLYEPIEGKITIDERDITEYELTSLRKAIAIISKEAFLFNNSILDNLTYGLKNISKSQVIAASRTTKVYDFITQLPQKFDSKINDREIALSEAQKQLIAITRALLSNPEIVILDEPMKNIGKSEREVVQHALDELCRERTTIMITNRLTAIKKANQIIILNKGKVIESGTHQELLQSGNLYKKMCSTQFKTSQQSHQQLLAKKIFKKLSRQNNNILSSEIKNNLSSLLHYLQLINEGLVDNNLEQEKILDESYQSAINMLASLREYQQRISRGLNNN